MAYVTPRELLGNDYALGTPLADAIDELLYPLLHKLFPKKFPSIIPPSSIRDVKIYDIELRTMDYKILVLKRVICQVSCQDEDFDHDKIANILRMALELAGGNMISQEIKSSKLQSLGQTVFKWHKLPELLGEHIDVYTLYMEPDFHC